MQADGLSISGAIDQVVSQLINKPDLSSWLAGNPQAAQQLMTLTRSTVRDAWHDNNRRSQRAAQQALFTLYQCHLAEPLSAASRNQYAPALTDVRQMIEQAWLDAEKRRYGRYRHTPDAARFTVQLRELWSSHPSSHHPLFDFLARQANEKQIYYFFKSDSALNLLFFDLVAMSLVGSKPETRGEISRNLWDEIGEGSNEFTHVNLYKDLLSRRGIALPQDHYAHLYDWQGLAGYNAFMLGAVNRQHYYKFIGVLAMTELLDPSQYEKLVSGCKRIGLNHRDVHYYSEHIEIDVVHADGWLNNVIAPIVQENPAAMDEIYFGAALRLQTCGDYYDHLLAKLHSL
ncbi:iron-containing redox enzyme family protein [Affinibrenneria salicis]|uniref:Iron-containing redox enzyme family protein n=1 Tax=Affinibrenneria salicis TaxID=2590031 RepID=A0A5J5G2F1_9GAMM|nr:iron-containing redox enzyme family protein [Affinibrenneria salicis]KAA9000749.1 iron-containing redox enzyme family protein [Affinibrenneria salicis]